MKQKNKKQLLQSLVLLVKNNKKTSMSIPDVSFIPFILSFFNCRKFLSVSGDLFDDVVGGFVLDSPGFFAVPFVDDLYKKRGVFDVCSYHEFLFKQAYYSSFSSVDVCVYDSLVFDKVLFKGDVGVFLSLSDPKLSFDSLVSFLDLGGYSRGDVLSSPGDYVVRGGIVDCFSFGGKKPFRISFLNKSVDVFWIDLVDGSVELCSEEVFVYPYSSLLDVSLSSFIKKEDLLISYRDGFLFFTNNLVGVGDVCFDASFSVLTFQKYRSLGVDFPVFYSNLLLSVGFLMKNFIVLPVWFRGGKNNKTKRSQLPDFELVVGDYYVHEFFGVCCFLGLEDSGEVLFDRVCLKFGDGVLKMDVRFLYRLSFFSKKNNNIIALDFLNKSSGWLRKKNKALKKAEEYVEHLVVSYGNRNSIKRNPCVFDESLFSFFMSSFQYQDTKDQFSAWGDIKEDLCSLSPMNRLLCGDVGFGKTEVALRAIFLCIMNNKKVVVVAPTTILSKQLFFCCLERFRGFGFKIKEVSRLTKNNSLSCSDFISGSVDVLVGTHSLSRNVDVLKKLDLIIIDEEHRFGVKDKEFVFSVNPSVDYLCMTATPIPRSLQFSLSGIRKISTMLTPPQLRKPIINNVFTFNKTLFLSCIKKEVVRGGSVFVVDNSVKNVLSLSNSLKKEFNNIGVSFLYGGLPKKQINKTMEGFRCGDVKILISTSIIESGIDISLANTIIINNSQMFGLSQLHQLRGRVGRSNRQAYAYFFVPLSFKKGSIGWRRLASLQKFSSLGAGYDLSMCDLDIRGAGSLFGYSQSGSSSVGFDYYSKLIKKIVSALPSSSIVLPDFLPFVFLGQGFFPKKYVVNEKDLLFLYKQISECVSLKKLFSLKLYVVNKYGSLPPSSLLLFDAKEISLSLKNSEINKVLCDNKEVEVFFSKMYVGGFELLVKLLDNFFRELSLSYSFKERDSFLCFSFKKTYSFVVVLKSLIGVLYE